MFYKKVVLKNFAKFTRKHLYQASACNFIIKEIWHRCFPAKFLRTTFYRLPPRDCLCKKVEFFKVAALGDELVTFLEIIKKDLLSHQSIRILLLKIKWGVTACSIFLRDEGLFLLGASHFNAGY